MPRLKKLTFYLPEYLLLCSVFFYWIATENLVNPIAIALALFLILQIIFRSRIVGLTLASVLVLLSLYMLLALISEEREFPSFNEDAQVLFGVGTLWVFGTLAISCMMIYTYFFRKEIPSLLQ